MPAIPGLKFDRFRCPILPRHLEPPHPIEPIPADDSQFAAWLIWALRYAVHLSENYRFTRTGNPLEGFEYDAVAEPAVAKFLNVLTDAALRVQRTSILDQLCPAQCPSGLARRLLELRDDIAECRPLNYLDWIHAVGHALELATGPTSPNARTGAPASPSEGADVSAGTDLAPVPDDSHLSPAKAAERARESDGAIPNRARKVGEQYRQAVEVLRPDNPNPTDREVHDAIAKALKQSGEAHELPEFATWQRYLRDWRKATGQQKKKPRAGRAQVSGSLVPYDGIEPRSLPTSIRPVSVDRSGRGADG